MFQSGPQGSKKDQNGEPKCFYHLGPFLARLDPFGPFQTKINFLPHMDKVGLGEGVSEQKINQT